MPAISRSYVPSFLFLFLLASISLAQTPAPDGPPYRVGGDISRPEKIAGASPEFTREAGRARVTGTVVVDALIDEQGDVKDVKLLQGLFTGLDEAAMAAIRTWKFKPARWKDRPVAVYYTLTVNFQLDSSPRLWLFDNAFLDANPRFEGLFRSRSYPEALALLDGQSSPEARVARTAVLAEMGRIDEALDEARAYEGADPEEVLNLVAMAALKKAAGLPEEQKEAWNQVLDAGMEAINQALATKDDANLMVTKSRLLRERAKRLPAPERAALVDEAVGLEKRAIELFQ